MLERSYRKVMPDPKAAVAVQIAGLMVDRDRARLEKLYEGLQGRRGHTNLTRQRTLARCVYVVAYNATSFVVELDESQHFTAARAISLKHDP